MRPILRALCLSVGIASFLPSRSEAQSSQWPGFRGGGDSRSRAVGLPLKWSDTENLAWQVELPGYGQSSPVIWNGRVFVTTVAGPMQDRCALHCVDLAAGKLLWSREIKGSQGVMTSDYVSKAAPTPAVDGDGVYALFETGDLASFSHTGEKRWQRSLVQEYGALKSNHGLGGSPVLSEKGLVVAVAHDGGSYLLLVDPKTGANRWKREHPIGVGWSTPVIARHNGELQILISAPPRLSAYRLDDGEPRWSVNGLAGNTVPSPSVEGDLAVLASSERGNTLAVKLGVTGDTTGAAVRWKQTAATCSFGSPLISEGRVYFTDRVGTAYCVSLASGAVEWETRLPASSWASPIAAGGRIYFFDTSGATTVFAAGPAMNKLAENRLTISGRVYGAAAVDGAVVIRSGTRLMRVGKPGPAPGAAK